MDEIFPWKNKHTLSMEFVSQHKENNKQDQNISKANKGKNGEVCVCAGGGGGEKTKNPGIDI